MELNTTNSSILHTEIHWPFAITQIVLSILAILGNGVIVLCFIFDKSLRNRQHYHLFSLALADICSALFGTLVSIPNHIGHPENYTLCVIGIASTTSFYLISVYNKISVSINRYWASVYYISYFTYNKLIYTKSMISMAWIFGSIPGIALVSGWHKHTTTNSCSYLDVATQNFQIVMCFLIYAVPELLLIFCYTRIIYTIKKKVFKKIKKNNSLLIFLCIFRSIAVTHNCH